MPRKKESEKNNKESKNKKGKREIHKEFNSFLSKNWIVEIKGSIPKNPKVLVGLPGIGNVAKIAADYLIDKNKLEPFLIIYGKYMPHSVIVNKDNVIEVPKIALYKLKNKKNEDIVIITGESQPITEESNYEFSELLFKLFDNKIKEIVAFAGRGLNNVPAEPKVAVVANDKNYLKKVIKELKKINKNVIYDEKEKAVVTITGLAGIIPGVAKIYDIKASVWMADTFSDPLFLGFNGSYELLRLLKDYWNLEIDLKELEEESNKIKTIVQKGGDIIKRLWEEQNKKLKEEKETLKKYYY
ncbi:MAG: PAC2 family protein [Nanoarchaeota archaeon]